MGDAIHELDVRSIAPFGDRVLVGGRFCSVHPYPGGGGAAHCISPVLVVDADSGTVLRPGGAERAAWFPIGGWWSGGHAIVARPSGVVVGLGDVGLVVLDPVTLAYDAPASAPFLNTGWWGRDETSGVFALALPAVAPGSGDAGRRCRGRRPARRRRVHPALGAAGRGQRVEHRAGRDLAPARRRGPSVRVRPRRAGRGRTACR